MNKIKQKPSEAELEILQELWEKPGLTVSEIHEKLEARKQVGYTTTLKQMQRMQDKGMLSRKKEGKLFIYFSELDEQSIKNSIFNKLSETLFKGSAKEMMMHLLGNQETTQEELRELKQWIEQKEKGGIK
ncbi:BlaI/MecI/CopY family transcriptional regulator [Marivirga harenae]|uniref:BlaI/MecI/CopY family transcriptional regulator n=1 Tax=Marivirga harenae TaxID=2010992 RepID=UPI0026E07BED|nr:BlaI/MecI/CopY family transcriptional regulator [Marivirga harenae]WKV10502.1 BlaI/MecI/CopY family transcriptional regulator [Marivirga harenae]|tara:strand:+ start:454291 stop:454680 length:390 start_codon:yes stop_codon:yes gene_type:complete